ncbi:MAG: hypothetical protein CSA38_01035 [Flavobacteriales bacterium]|nr:MAG: hypothetical protein CSA38_01035 [Flavobacteriales bacterium]
MKKQIISSLLSVLLLTMIFSCSREDLPSNNGEEPIAPPVENTIDINHDGQLNILILGTSKSIDNHSTVFSCQPIATELHKILTQDTALNLDINVSFEDIYQSKVITFGLGQSAHNLDFEHYSHSLMQYYYWPENQEQRWANLEGHLTKKWDFVIISADTYTIEKIPGYYALGVNKIASKIAKGGAKPLLLMQWNKNATTASFKHFEEFTYRTADGAKTQIEVVPAGLAWESLPDAKKDEAAQFPTPNGVYLTASAIYTQMTNKSAKDSDYQYDDEIADLVLTNKENQKNKTHYTGERNFMSPFKACNIEDNQLNYNHTGSSSEYGILQGLKWVVLQSNRTLVNGGAYPINFNYGRANTNFEAHKRYKIDPTKFDFSFGFPMQDNGNHGNNSMLYGLDKRYSQAENGTDLGTALYMIRNAELPNARAIPIRTLYAQLQEAIPHHSAYSDNWHMHGNLNKAIGAYMFTMLTGENVLPNEPADINSNEWKAWKAHQIGYETAHTLMYLRTTP